MGIPPVGCGVVLGPPEDPLLFSFPERGGSLGLSASARARRVLRLPKGEARLASADWISLSPARRGSEESVARASGLGASSGAGSHLRVAQRVAGARRVLRSN